MNFTEKDTLGILVASLALIPVLLAPGYTLGWALDLFQFRRRRPILRVFLGVTLSIAVTPMLAYLLARYIPVGLWVFYAASFLGFAWLLAIEVGRLRMATLSRYGWWGALLIAGWVVIAVSSLVDLQWDKNLYLPIPAYDHATRVSMLGAVASRMPPENPFFAHPGVPLRYHYLWLLLISLPHKLWHFSLRDLTFAGVLWCGIGLISLIGVGVKFLLGLREQIEQKTLLGVLLLSVTGLDILPTFYMAWADKFWLSDMEWWNDVQVSSWITSLLWVPHNLAALIACTIGFLMLRNAEREERRSAVYMVIGGVAFASAAGLSVYVTFTFVVAVALWLMVLVARKDWREALLFIGAGVVALIVALPFLKSLGGVETVSEGSRFVDVALRPFQLGIHIAGKLGFTIKSPGAILAVKVLGLPFNYLLELGFFLGILLVRVRHISRGLVRATKDEIAAWVLVGTSFLVGTFLRSSTIETNDLGIRCFLIAQLVMLLWAANYLYEWVFSGRVSPTVPRRRTKIALGICLVLGMMGTGYELFMYRFFPVLKDHHAIDGGMLLDEQKQAGLRTYSLRFVYEKLDEELPFSAIIQSNPTTTNHITNMIYSGHEAIAGLPDCGTTFGGRREDCYERLGRLFLVFSDPYEGTNRACTEYGIDAIVVQDSDPIWKDESSWVWVRKPLAASKLARAFRCESSEGTQPGSGK